MSNYLYNNIELPELPERDKTIYPYAYIAQSLVSGTYTLYFSQSPVYYKSGYRVPAPFLRSYHDAETNTWGEFTEGTSEYTQTAVEIAIWANHDVVYTSSSGAITVKLAASDPIPVYTPIPVSLYHKLNNLLNPITLYRKESGENKKLTLYRGET